MKTRIVVSALLATTALTSTAQAQQAIDAGTIVVTAPEAQPGLTAAPTDLAIQRRKRAQAALAAKRRAAEQAEARAAERRAAAAQAAAQARRARSAERQAAQARAAEAAAEADAAEQAALQAQADAAAFAAANPDAVPGRPTSAGGVQGAALGGGFMIKEEAKKTRSTVTRDAIDKQGPAANPYQVISLLPGVIMSSTDNDGANGGNIRLRGFNSTKVGMTIEGAPINDSGNYELYPQEYVDSQNMEQVSIAQGSPDLDSPHIGSTGGVINLYMREPSDQRGGYQAYSFGSNNLARQFIRLETGQVGAFKAYLSYSHLDKDNWAGPGEDERNHVDFKAQYDISPGNTVRLSAMYNNAINNFYRQPTLNQFKNPGFGTAAGNGALNTGGTSTAAFSQNLPPAFFNTVSPIDQNPVSFNANFNPNNSQEWHGYRINPFRNLILSAPSDFTITEKLKFDTIPYFWYGYGSGGGTAELNENGFFTGNTRVRMDLNGNGNTSDPGVMLYNPSVTDTSRPGVINKITYEAGNHTIVAGHWFEYAWHRQTAPHVALKADGSIANPWADSNQIGASATATCTVALIPVTCPTGPLQRRNQSTETMTNMLFIGDTWKATDKLQFDFGAKHVFVDRRLENKLPGSASLPGGAEQSLFDSEFLPTAGVSYQIDDANRVFANYATSFRSAPNFTLVPFVNTTTGAVAMGNPVEPERGQVFEVGHRYQGSLFATSISAFYGQYENYQESTSIPDPSNPANTVNATTSIGAVRNYGINAEIGTRPINNFRPYASVELLRAELLDNLPITRIVAGSQVADTLRTAGKELPGAPNYSLGLGLDYDNGTWLGNLAYKYVGPQYSTYLNDEQLDAYGKLDAMIGYRFADFGYLKQPELKLNLYNVLDTRQLIGVAGTRNNALATTQTGSGASVAGSAPTYFQGEGVSATVTFSSAF